MTDEHRIHLTVNGVAHDALVEPHTTLADFIRHDIGLTGTHVACEHGVCGACTVIINGEPVRSCLILAVQAGGAEVTTIEGVSTEHALHPVQQALRDSHAFQCGFCAPGFVMSGIVFVEENPTPTRDEIRHAVSSTLGRCGDYLGIIDGFARLAANEGDGGP